MTDKTYKYLTDRAITAIVLKLYNTARLRKLSKTKLIRWIKFKQTKYLTWNLKKKSKTVINDRKLVIFTGAISDLKRAVHLIRNNQILIHLKVVNPPKSS